jgi:hypothetical protein
MPEATLAQTRRRQLPVDAGTIRCGLFTRAGDPGNTRWLAIADVARTAHVPASLGDNDRLADAVLRRHRIGTRARFAHSVRLRLASEWSYADADDTAAKPLVADAVAAATILAVIVATAPGASMTGQGLLKLAASLTGRSQEDMGRQAGNMLGPSIARTGRWRSTINNDGSPLQLCIGLQVGAAPVIRLLADPAAKTSDIGQRKQELEQAVDSLLEQQAPDMHAACQVLMERMLPADTLARAALSTGGAWLATNLSGPGMALYVSTKWGDPAARWSRARHWLGGLVPDRLARHTQLVSAGIEGHSAATARAKLYWRIGNKAALADLGLSLAESAEVRDFLSIVIGTRHIPRSAIVGSIGIPFASAVAEEMPGDIKLDVCAHCVQRPPEQWLTIIERCCRRYGLTWCHQVNDLAAFGELAFIGLGLDQTHRPRLNLYLKSLPQ